MDSLLLAPVVTGDLPLLEEWFKDAETAHRLGGMLPLPEHFNSVKAQEGQDNWLAYEDEMPVGFACLEAFADGTAAVAVLARPDMRRKGYGRRIVEAVISEARSAGVKTINGYIESDNAACGRTLARAGFSMTSGPDEDGFFTYSIELQPPGPAAATG